MKAARTPVLLVVAALSACVGPSRAPRSAPPVRQPPAPPARPASAIIEQDASTGSWTYGKNGDGSVAILRPADGLPLFALRCIRPSRVIMASALSASAPPGAITMTFRTSTMTKAFAARWPGGGSTTLSADIAATDPVLDAAAFSRGRFTVSVGSVQIVMPTWPEVTRVIEDCRG